MITVKIQSQYVLDRPISGTSFTPEMLSKVDLLKQYVSNLYIYGVKPTTKGKWTTANLVNDASDEWDIDHFNLAMSFPETTIENYMPKIKVADADINNPVPDGLPNTTTKPEYQKDENGEYVLDENNEPIISIPSRKKTWVEWLTVQNEQGEFINYAPTIHEGFHYFYSHGGNGGFALSGEELVIVRDSPDATLVDELPAIEVI